MWAARIVPLLFCSLPVLETKHRPIRNHGVADRTEVSSALDDFLPFCGTESAGASGIIPCLPLYYIRSLVKIELWLTVSDNAAVRRIKTNGQLHPKLVSLV